MFLMKQFYFMSEWFRYFYYIIFNNEIHLYVVTFLQRFIEQFFLILNSKSKRFTFNFRFFFSWKVQGITKGKMINKNVGFLYEFFICFLLSYTFYMVSLFNLNFVNFLIILNNLEVYIYIYNKTHNTCIQYVVNTVIVLGKYL